MLTVSVRHPEALEELVIGRDVHLYSDASQFFHLVCALVQLFGEQHRSPDTQG